MFLLHMSLGCLQALEFYNTQIIISVWQTKIPSLHTLDVQSLSQERHKNNNIESGPWNDPISIGIVAN